MLEPVDAVEMVLQQLLARLDAARRARRGSVRSTISWPAPACAATSCVTLADIGALNAFGYDRRSALWQAERAIRPSGELFRDEEGTAEDAKTAEIFFET